MRPGHEARLCSLSLGSEARRRPSAHRVFDAVGQRARRPLSTRRVFDAVGQRSSAAALNAPGVRCGQAAKLGGSALRRRDVVGH
jgi:hypothetical protein